MNGPQTNAFDRAVAAKLKDPDEVLQLLDLVDGQFLQRQGDFIGTAVPSGTSHLLGGAQHTPDTLANLNSKISDATLDDSSANRTDATAIHDNVTAEISAITLKNPIETADVILLESLADGNAKRSTTFANIPLERLGTLELVSSKVLKPFGANAVAWGNLVATEVGAIASIVAATDNALVRFDGITGGLVQNSVGLLNDAGVLTGLTQITMAGSILPDINSSKTLGSTTKAWSAIYAVNIISNVNLQLGTVAASNRLNIGTTVVTSNVKFEVIGDLEIGATDAFHYGDFATDTTWRTIRDGTKLAFQRRETGTYVEKAAFQNNQINFSVRLDINDSGNLPFVVRGGTTTFDPADVAIAELGGLLLRSADVAGVASEADIVATGTDSGNFPSRLRFWTRASAGNPVLRLSIDESGVVNIVNLGASLDVQTDGNSNLVTVSDERQKNIYGPVKYGLKEVLGLNPILYNLKTDPEGSRVNIGFGARDVARMIPEAAGLCADGEHFGLNSRGILAAVVNAIKELHGLIDAEESRLVA